MPDRGVEHKKFRNYDIERDVVPEVKPVKYEVLLATTMKELGNR